MYFIVPKVFQCALNGLPNTKNPDLVDKLQKLCMGEVCVAGVVKRWENLWGKWRPSTPTPHNGYTTGFQHSTKHTLTDEGDHFLLDAGWVPVPGEVLWSEDVDHNGAETVLDKRDLVELLATKNYWKPKLYWKLILYNKNSSLLMLLHNFFQNGRTFYWSLTECIRSLFKKLRKKHLQSQTLSHSSLRGLFTFSVFYFNIALRLYTRLFTNSMTLQGS